MTVHRMQLRGPWEYVWLDGPHRPAHRTPQPPIPTTDAAPGSDLSEDEQSTAGRTKMPIGWQDAFGDVTGTVELRRRFHKPTNLDPGERVFVAFHGLAGAGSISVNGTRLGEFTLDTDTISYDITKLLTPGNLIAVELQIDGDAPIEQAGLWGPVTIEIHPPQPHAPHA